MRNQRKGYFFITFESDSSSKELIRLGKQVLGGKEVDVKKVQPTRPDQQSWDLGMGLSPGQHVGRYGRGGGGVPRGARGGRHHVAGAWADAGWGGDWGQFGYGEFDETVLGPSEFSINIYIFYLIPHRIFHKKLNRCLNFLG